MDTVKDQLILHISFMLSTYHYAYHKLHFPKFIINSSKISVEKKSDKIQNYCTHKLRNYDQLN